MANNLNQAQQALEKVQQGQNKLEGIRFEVGLESLDTAILLNEIRDEFMDLCTKLEVLVGAFQGMEG